MLSTGSTDGRGIVGKVGDFGLSLKMDVHETHISQVFQGTLSHMAPGMLTTGLFPYGVVLASASCQHHLLSVLSASCLHHVVLAS
jgi:hypothetical protein